MIIRPKKKTSSNITPNSSLSPIHPSILPSQLTDTPSLRPHQPDTYNSFPCTPHPRDSYSSSSPRTARDSYSSASLRCNSRAHSAAPPPRHNDNAHTRAPYAPSRAAPPSRGRYTRYGGDYSTGSSGCCAARPRHSAGRRTGSLGAGERVRRRF